MPPESFEIFFPPGVKASDAAFVRAAIHIAVECHSLDWYAVRSMLFAMWNIAAKSNSVWLRG